MDNNIILDNNLEQPESGNNNKKKENLDTPNLFQGRTEAVNANSKFPDWDIVPANQFINPRLKPL